MTESKPLNSADEVPRWSVKESKYLARCRVFNLRKDVSIHSRDQTSHDFYVLEAPDWVNVIAITEDGNVVLIEQHRHGTGDRTLEIPGGMVDEGEEPIQAAARELFEETGYRPGNMLYLGKTRPNPAIQNNFLHSFVAQWCRFEAAPEFHDSEHTIVRLERLSEIPSLIATGAIDHALVVAAFHKFSLL